MGIVHTVSTGEWHNFSPLENSQISLNSFHFFFFDKPVYTTATTLLSGIRLDSNI